jgi:hypothetical protein
MPKMAIERELDSLVAASDHDRLSGSYFRALLEKEGNVDEAKTALLKWTRTNKSRRKWDGNAFRLSSQDGQ